jgi:hypothetical protein
MTAENEWNAIRDADIEDVFPRYTYIYAEIQKRGLATFEQMGEC